MDKEKLDEMYRENAAMIYKYLCGLTQDSGLDEDLTQETFFQAMKGIDKFRGDCKISVWLFADAFIYALSTCKKNKGSIAMAVISIGAFVLLSVIQITQYYLIGTGTFWLFRYGVPILLLWLFALWLPVLAKTFLKWNIWDCIALFLFLVIAGNYITKLITGDYMWEDVLHMQGFIGNALGEVIGIIVFGIIGRIEKWRK